jgi:hypothetical protein
MTADNAIYIPPYKADDQDVVVELNNRFGAEAFVAQETRTGMPVLWVKRAQLKEVLTFLRGVPSRTSCCTTCTAWTSACAPSAAACRRRLQRVLPPDVDRA